MAYISQSEKRALPGRARTLGARRTPRRMATRTLIYIILVIVLIVQFFPLLWALLTSLMQQQETTTVPATLLPASPTLSSYVQAIQGDLGVYYRNSIIASTVSTAITMTLGVLAAYAFARLRFRFKTPLLFFVLFLSLFPPLAQVIPVYQVLQALHLLGGVGALILPYSVFGLPLGVIILIAFFQDVPRELEEAAIVDGLGRLGAFLRIIVPVTLPGIFTAAMIVFVNDWNEYLFALNYTNNGAYTLPVGIVNISQTEFTTNFGILSAATILSIVPLIILTVLLERRIVSGLTAGALKG